MGRRTFLLFSLFLFITKSFAYRKEKNRLLLIKEVLNHLFPKTEKFHGAEEFGAFGFLIFVSRHPTFSKNDFDFLIEGTDELLSRYENFMELPFDKKEKLLKEFESSGYGQNWLSFLLYYGLEAMLGDPIYKGNKHMSGWENINHTPPNPMAKTPFGKQYV